MFPRSDSSRELLWLGVFGVAFGYLKAAVVAYLRAIAYPAGFTFPLAPIPPLILEAEIGREVATLAMLGAVAAGAGGTGILKFSRFLYGFGLWDIFYYVGLKVLLDWPASIFTWDILFLIPVPWSAPVLAPALAAVFFVGVGVYGISKRGLFSTRKWQWGLGIGGAVSIGATFIWNVGPCVSGTMPGRYPWVLYILGFAAWLVAFGGAVQVSRRGRRVRA